MFIALAQVRRAGKRQNWQQMKKYLLNCLPFQRTQSKGAGSWAQFLASNHTHETGSFTVLQHINIHHTREKLQLQAIHKFITLNYSFFSTQLLAPAISPLSLLC